MSDKPLPDQSKVAKPYWRAATEGRLEIQRCESCERFVFPPRYACPYCHSESLAWTEVSGEGSIYTYSVVHRSPTSAWEGETPYVIAIVELEEGAFIFSSVSVDPTEVQVGQPVNVVFEQRNGVALPKFVPADT